MTTATFSQAWTSANRDAWIAQGARACARIYVVIVDKKDPVWWSRLTTIFGD